MNHFRFLARAAALMALSAGLNGCAEQLVSVQPKDPTERALTSTNLSPTGYRLTAGDRVRVSVFDLAAESAEYVIDDTGTISIPALEPVAIKGQTTKEAAATIAKGYGKAGLYRSARVSVDVISFGPFYVLGEIAKPGEFAYRPGMSLFAAVALAGGHTYRANRGRVFIRRAGDPIETEYDVTADIAILPGDVVRIPEIHL
jgi:protein involved in polysaccharide export with SLBB domain